MHGKHFNVSAIIMCVPIKPKERKITKILKRMDKNVYIYIDYG